jgi:hypothetical protein
MYVKSFIVPEFLPFIGSLPDFFAVKDGIKPLSRITVKPKDLKRTIQTLQEYDLFYTTGIKDGLYNIYISKDAGMLRQYPRKDPETGTSMTRKSASEFASDLGYPECCIEEYTGRNTVPAREYYENFFRKKRLSFLMNNFLMGGSNFFLSFHKPCSMECRRSRKYNGMILQSIERNDKKYHYELLLHIRAPKILMLDVSAGINESWDNRFSIITALPGRRGILLSKPPYSKLDFGPNFYENVRNSESVHLEDNNILSPPKERYQGHSQ